jgi:hypothetical protein
MKNSLSCIVIIIMLCTSCQMGKIPCPKVKEAKLRKHYRSSVFTARANTEPSETNQNQRIRDPRSTIQNISLAEWDCPKPGKKRYLPKAVKENIRKNLNKINSDTKKD